MNNVTVILGIAGQIIPAIFIVKTIAERLIKGNYAI